MWKLRVFALGGDRLSAGVRLTQNVHLQKEVLVFWEASISRDSRFGITCIPKTNFENVARP